MTKTLGIVTTKFGRVSGVPADGPEYEGITVFKGIPFAAPPVGALRWKPPVDPEPWEGVRACDTFAPMACQNMGSGLSFKPWGTDFYYMGTPDTSEDCLYLNVFTGAREPGEKRPVYMWFHGGGLSTGYSWEIEFDGSELAKRGIVVVQVAQRLNVFGRRPVFGSPLEPAVHDQFYFFLIFGITLVRFLLLHIHFDRIDELSGGDGLHIIAYVFADEGASSRAGKLNHKSFFCTHNKKLLKYILNVFSRSDSECASRHHLRCV